MSFSYLPLGTVFVLRGEDISKLSVSTLVQDRRNCLATALKEVAQTFPRDMENEKAMLIMTMLLARKVADHTPSLLRDVFHSTVNFINENLFAYVRNLVRNVRTSDTSTLQTQSSGPLLPTYSLCSLGPLIPHLPDDQTIEKLLQGCAVLKGEVKPFLTTDRILAVWCSYVEHKGGREARSELPQASLYCHKHKCNLNSLNTCLPRMMEREIKRNSQ
jgi:hypothetical protein